MIDLYSAFWLEEASAMRCPAAISCMYYHYYVITSSREQAQDVISLKLICAAVADQSSQAGAFQHSRERLSHHRAEQIHGLAGLIIS